MLPSAIVEGELVDLADIAARLDADEKLQLKYKIRVRSADGGVAYETRTGQLLDVAEEPRLLYVRHQDQVIWVKLDEAIEVSALETA